MNELFTRMQYEPSILMFGNKYKRLNSTVLDYAWNAIVTTNCDLSLSAVLKNDMRAIVDVIKKDNMQANLMDRKRLHIIRLFGETYPAEPINRNEILTAKDVCSIIWSEKAYTESSIGGNKNETSFVSRFG